MKKIKNSWQEGLVMDFAPENTSPNCLTSALNATILTYNGNENMLQNDMGNARIETAFLPEGYIPVGTCEYGDIIYVVSYNPLINKSQIGCFPSPERNISSDEVSNLNQLLSNDDFLEIKNEEPTGNLKSSSVKKIIYDKKLLPGDKYFIYLKGGNEESFKNFSDYNGNGLNSLPKYLKAHVISILDDGKIELLDSSVKWYDKYFIPTIQVEPNKTPDLDSYRDALSSGYSIFASKISGKLALLVELEKITGFNCTYSVIEDPILTTEEPPNPLYKIYWNINWSTDNNDINPKYIVLTKSNSTEDNIPKAYPDEGYYYKEINLGMPKKYSSDIDYTYYNYNSSLNLQCYLPTFAPHPNKPRFYRTIKNFQKIKSKRDNLNLPVESYYYLDPAFTEIKENEIIYKNNNGDVLDPLYVNDIIVNNYFKSPIYKEFADFPKGDYIYEYEITPAMPYGLLKEYAVQGSIDFSKIGTDFVLLHTWKYYNTEDYITLTLGLDAYTSENKAIAGIDLKFYDAYGLTAVYTISNKESYSGTFTEYIPLNGINPSYKLTNKNNNNLILHKGNSLNDLKITELQEGYLYETDGNLYLIQYHNDEYYYYINNDGEEVSLLVLEDNILQNSYINDSGILYPNILYGVEIVIKNYPLDALGQFDTTTEDFFKRDYRWMWTNQMLNSQYKYLKDFKDAVGDLTLDLDVFYQTTNQWFKKEYSIEYPLEITNTSSELYKNLSANVQEVTGTNNIKGDLIIKLKDNFNTFKLNAGTKGNADTTDNCILSEKTQLLVLEGKSHIKDISGTVIQTNDSKFDIFEGIYPENNITPNIAINSKITSPYFEECASNPIYLKSAGYNKVEITNTIDDVLNYITLTGPISVCINIDNIELIEKIEISLSSVNEILKSQNELSSEKFLINLDSFHNNNSSSYPYTIYKNDLSHIENNKYRLFYIYLPCYYTLIKVIDGDTRITRLTESLIEIKNCKVHFKPGENIETPLEILPDQPTVKVSTNNDSTGSEIEFINNKSSEISLLKQFTKPSVNLNTAEWRQYKNNYILKIENSSTQLGVNLNYITCNNQEDNLTDPMGLNLTNSMSNYLENRPISINYSFNGIHYSKFYKEASPSTKQIQKLVPLLNTSTDLAKYNLRIYEGHLYFSLFTEMGVGCGNDSHRVINLAMSNDHIVGKTTQTHYWSNGGNNKLGITKYTNSHEYWSLWKSKIRFNTGDTVYLKDIISGIVPVLIGRQNTSDGHMMDITESYSRDVNIPASTNAISLPENYEIAEIIASTDGYRFSNNDLTKLCLCSFLMKDINGDLHALNNIFPLNVDNDNKIQQTIYSQGNTIGNVIASALSNMYIVSNLYDNLLSNKLTNLIHLRNLQSKFSKDLIYKFSINKDVDYKDLVLVCGVSLNDYINSILQKLQALDEKLVLIGINDIIKNIPILFNFDYIEPEKSYDFDTILYISIRKSTDDVISSKPINYNLDLNTIYFIDTDDSIKKLESYIPFYEIDSVSTTELGEIKYQYKNTLLKHFEMEYFTYKDGMLTLVKTNYPNEQLYQISPHGRNEAVSGIVKNEYLTTIGKYV